MIFLPAFFNPYFLLSKAFFFPVTSSVLQNIIYLCRDVLYYKQLKQSLKVIWEHFENDEP